MGQFIAILTFPGIIIHELSHELFCRLLGVKVRKVCYFKLGNPAGYVVHEQSRHFYQAFLISVGPFILGTFMAAASFWIGDKTYYAIKKYILIWIAFSIAINCLPSRGDAKSLLLENWAHLKQNILAIMGLPFTALIWMMSMLDSFWPSAFYAGFLFYYIWKLAK